MKNRNFLQRLFLGEESTIETRTIVVHENQESSPGTFSYAGYNQEDYLGTLHGTDRADIFDKMRRGDSQIEMCLMATKAPIIGATWEVQPGVVPGEEPTDEAKADADLIRHILFEDMEQSFEEKLEEAATCVDFGHSVLEMVDKVVKKHRRYGSYNGIGNLSWISPRTISRWNLDPQTGKLISISQLAHGDLYKNKDLDARFLLVFNVKKEGANYEGRSFQRHCYGSWLRKNNYMKINAVGVEKFAVPTPVATVPAGKGESGDVAKVERILQAYTTHHKQFIMIPEGWKLEWNNNVYDPQKVELSIDNEDKRIAKGFLMNFLELGMNGFGSQSLSVDLSDFSLNTLKYVSNKIRGVYNRQLIPRLIMLNKGERDVYPQLVCSGIDDRVGKELADVMASLSTGKILTPDDKLEINIRKRYGLPPMSEEGREDRRPTPLAGQVPDPNDPNLTLMERIRAINYLRIKGMSKS